MYDVADAVSGFGEGVPFDRWVCVRDGAAHVAGDKTVILAVQEDDRIARVLHRADGIRFVQVKSAEQAGAPFYQRHRERWRQLHIAADLADDIGRRVIRTVRHDAADLRAEIERGCHQHGRGTHGHAVEQDADIAAKAIHRPAHPVAAVEPLVNAKGDGVSRTFTVCSLVDQQHIVSERVADADAAAHIAHCRAAVTVKTEIKRRAVPVMIVSAAKGQTIMRSDRNCFKRARCQIVDQRGHFSAIGGILVVARDVVDIFLRLVGRIERLSINEIEYDKKQDRCCGQHPEKIHVCSPPL